ncbi:AraC family transcriptional regulator [Nocardia sp. NPDC051030]|uniref:AraC family transcriptional regulator n=1 Tax=Nocardia sp. NPDC051030 TaxID=3155162 RepID=UPI00342E2A98
MSATMTVPLRRSAAGAAILLDVGIERGVSVETLLRDSRLDEHEVRLASAEIESWQEQAVARNLLAACDEPCLGLIAGSRYRITTYGAWGLGMATSPTVREAIELGVRYVGLTHSFCAMRLEEDRDTARFFLDASAVPDDLRVFFTERSTAACFMTFRGMLPGALVEYTNFAYPAPPGMDRYQEILGAPAHFDAEQTFAVLDRGILDLRLPRANEGTARWYEQQARELLDQRGAHPSLAGEVRDHLFANPHRLPTAAETAMHFEISTRTLSRRLAADGTNYRELLDEVRERLAEELLQAGLSVEETSRRLGYAEPASFQHAFRRWKDMSPGRFARERKIARA